VQLELDKQRGKLGHLRLPDRLTQALETQPQTRAMSAPGLQDIPKAIGCFFDQCFELNHL
jgi:hypothetical protein